MAAAAAAALPARPASLRPVVNATGVVLHTNLGRAPLGEPAVRAMADAAGTVDVEFDLETGRRAPRGKAALDALLAAVPEAEAALVVGNGAAALVLAATALAADGEVVISRGEMVEIGDGFRLPALLESTGARLREVGTTNRSTVADYREAVGERTGFVLKVHPVELPRRRLHRRGDHRRPRGGGASASRSSPTPAAGCSTTTRCCPASRRCAARSPTARTS